MKNIFKRKNIKLFLLALIFILSLIFIYVMYERKNVNNGDGDNYLKLSFDQEKPIIVKVADKYGFININGENITEPIYSEVDNFHGKYALVTQKNEEETEYKIIDRQGSVKKSSRTTIKRLYEQDLWIIENVLYDNNLNQITDSNMNIKSIAGDYFLYEVINEQAPDVETPLTTQRGIINRKNEIIYNSTLDFKVIYQDSGKEFVPYALIENTYLDGVTHYLIYNLIDKKAVVDSTDKVRYLGNNVFDLGYKTIYFKTNDQYHSIEAPNTNLSVYKNNPNLVLYYDADKKGVFYDLEKKTNVDKPDSKSVFYETTGYQDYVVSDKVGIIKDNEVVLDAKYRKIETINTTLYKYLKNDLHRELILIYGSDTVSLYNLTTKKNMITFKTNYISTFSTSPFLTYIDNDTKENVVYNTITGNIIKFAELTTITTEINYFKVKDEQGTKVYNRDFKLIYSE